MRHTRQLRTCTLGLLTLLFLGGFSSAVAKVIHVPSDQPTIQAGMDAAFDEDQVLVSPGTYFENINFNGKAIAVNSVDGPKSTIIDGGRISPTVTFSSGESRRAKLSGFTVTNGVGNDGGGVEICCTSSPSIVGNWIVGNTAVEGGGIYIAGGAPLIQDNTISQNTGRGAGLAVEGGGEGLEIVGNKIIGNLSDHADAGGMLVLAAGSALIRNNLIAGNISTGVAPASHGGAIYLLVGAPGVVFAQNVLSGNTADQGAGLYLEIGDGEVSVVNNTIVGNDASQQGSAIYVIGLNSSAELYNNLAIGRHGQNAVDCDPLSDPNPPILMANDAFAPGGTDYLGTCVGRTGTNGNLSVKPRFVDALHRNFHLRAGSPAIDAGKNSAPHLPDRDYSGKPRIKDGNGDGKGFVDMGVYEYQPQ